MSTETKEEVKGKMMTAEQWQQLWKKTGQRYIQIANQDIANIQSDAVQAIHSQLAKLTREKESQALELRAIYETLDQLSRLANINTETRTILARLGNKANSALAMGKEK